MKNLIKKILLMTGVLDFVRFAYNAIRGMSLRMIVQEITFRSTGLPDKKASPPMKLIFLIIGTPWLYEYWNSGVKIVDDLYGHLNHSGLTGKSFHRILDFGCGCARLTRHLTRFNGANIYGSDYNPLLIEWCTKKLPFAEFNVNNLEPPLKYESGFFNFVLARSVFTHLGYDLQKKWINELYRIIVPGGILYFSTHGNSMINNLDGKDIEKYKNKELVVQYQQLEGDNKCTSFESKEWVLKNLQGEFKFVNFIEGKSDKHLRQDIFIFQK